MRSLRSRAERFSLPERKTTRSCITVVTVLNLSLLPWRERWRPHAAASPTLISSRFQLVLFSLKEATPGLALCLAVTPSWGGGIGSTTATIILMFSLADDRLRPVFLLDIAIG
ncbi:hypothetical protein ILYODFUR_020749 [Ilyodon furcidens]|uniref:Uncharacterized protein n=1 Tax=Ilyodon furcidens TaxID=33524 RepID=A0ABV0UTS0_9TELE